MQKCYSVSGSVAAGAAKAAINLHHTAASPTTRPAIFQIHMGTSDTPVDAQYGFALKRTTAIGTEGSGFTPVPVDPSQPAALADAGVGTYSVEPTKTASSELLRPAFNHRGVWSWHALLEAARLVIPATQNNGICLECIAVSTGSAAILSTIFFAE